MRKWMNLIERAIQHSVESRAFHSGQHDLTLSFTLAGKLIGYIDYSVFDDEVHIQMIKVLPAYRRQGFGTEMLKTLQAEYPETEISLGTLTDEGSKLVSSMKTREVPNGDIPDKMEELTQVRNKIEALKLRHDDLMKRVHDPDFDQLRQEFIDDVGDSWSALYDREYELEREIGDRSSTKRIFEQELPLLSEKYTRPNVDILHYMRDESFDPYPVWWAICSLLAESGYQEEVAEVLASDGLPEDWTRDDLQDLDPELWFKLPKHIRDEIAEQVVEYIMRNDAASATTKMHASLENKQLLPRTTWMVHFTDDPWAIRRDGFLYGTDSMEYLGLTTDFNKESKKDGGYNFAFPARSRDALAGTKYGRHAVMFQSSGILTHHWGDEEDQIIFWGPDVDSNDIAVILNDHGSWVVMAYRGTRSGQEIARKDRFQDVVDWVIKNRDQYRRYL